MKKSWHVMTMAIFSCTAFSAYVVTHADARPIVVTERADVAGRWEGKVTLPGAELAFNVDFTEDGGALKGDISIPMQGAKDLPLENVRLSGDEVTFAIAGVGGSPTFTGKVSADGAAIEGEFTQGPIKAPFKMSRGVAPEKAAADAMAGFDAWLESARAAWKVPGVSIAVVKDGKVIYTSAAGKRDVENDLPMTPDTLLAIGSSTKAFTTTVLATLVDEGKLDWDVPVRTYMPDFAIADEEASRGMTAVDLVTHRSGMPRHDLLWYNSTLTRGEMFSRLKHLVSNKAPRTEFQYNNLMYLSAGVLIERMTEKTWEDAVRERVLTPLGMTRSVFRIADVQKDADHALPYRETDEVVSKIGFRDIESMGPAGSIMSSANEMSRWVAAQLNTTGSTGAKLVNASTLTKLQSSHMHMGGPMTSLDNHVVAVGYGLGWFIDVYRGHRRVHHGGNIDGFSAMVMLLPEDGAGLVVLTNLDGTSLPSIVAQHATDRLLGLESVDWSGKLLGESAVARSMLKDAKDKQASVRKEGTVPAHVLTAYAGGYEHPGYGVIDIGNSGSALQFTYNRLSAPMEHWHYEVFNCLKNTDEPVLEGVKVQFMTGFDGEVEGVRLTMDPSVEPVVFKRKADALLTDAAHLAKLAGEYQLGPQTVRCEVRGRTLWTVMPGQPAYELVAERNNTFALKGLAGFKVRFEVDDAGAVKTATFIQPNGVFTAVRK